MWRNNFALALLNLLNAKLTLSHYRVNMDNFINKVIHGVNLFLTKHPYPKQTSPLFLASVKWVLYLIHFFSKKDLCSF